MAKKLQLTYKEIEDRLRVFRDEPFRKEDIGYTLLWAFGKPEREIDRFREGKGVIKTFDGLLIKGLFCYKASTTLQFASELDALKADPQVLKSAPKIIAVSDGQTIRAYDTRERNTFEQQVARLFCDFEFFYPLAGVERVEYTEESPADIKAAEKLAKLHDEIRAYNEFTSDSDLHDLNTFIARLLFCFFAEDTGIFPAGSFTHAIQQYSRDGITLKDVLEQLFRFMGGKPLPEGLLRTYCQEHFAFVGGGLFERDIYIPQLSFKARQIIIDSGELNWQDINPDIFGSMIQAVVNPDVRANQGMHYTSVPNIMKVINPLFMDELNAQYKAIEDAYESLKANRELGMMTDNQLYDKCKPLVVKCDHLMLRMSKMKFFDPACGSGNFLIITYKMLRLLEIKILKLKKDMNSQRMLEFIDSSCITLRQFYGIELLDFPHEVAMLSLWLAEHQMNKKMHDNFTGVNINALPLKEINNIRCANACRVDWNEVCPHTKEEEVYVFGNPPYLGVSLQDKSQKRDMELSIGKYSGYKKIDYIGVWFIKGAAFVMDNNSRCAFVSTNSICQGEMVEPLWSAIFGKHVYIDFAYESFKWKNNAKYNAGVTCTIIGISKENKKDKLIYNSKGNRVVKSISPYITEGSALIVGKHTTSISLLPQIIRGCMPYDGGNLLLSKEEKNSLLSSYPKATKYIKEIYSAADYIKGSVRYCLWISSDEYQDAILVPEIAERIERTKQMRLSSPDEGARNLAERPYQFREFNPCTSSTLVISSTSSENRKYIPMGYATDNMVVTNAMYMVENASLDVYGIITSCMHMMWMKTIGGRLKTDYRYTNMCYNSFPFPPISDAKRTEIEEAATDILLTREPYLTMGKTLADLYDPDTMPADLKAAHERLDGIVESCYPGAPFASDEARLECLFKLYEKMTSKK